MEIGSTTGSTAKFVGSRLALSLPSKVSIEVDIQAGLEHSFKGIERIQRSTALARVDEIAKA